MLTAAKNALKAFVRSCGYTIRRVDNTQFFDFDALLYFQLQRHGELCFVQIGSCDGVSFDPIRGFVERNQSRIRGVVIEPLPDLFQQLQANYRRFPRIVPVNCAVHNSEREMTLHRVDPQRLADVPDWACGIASFDPLHHQRLGIPADCMTTERVPCRTLPAILREHPLPRIDLLQIDTEGYDSEILFGLDFLEICPSIIRFEHGLHNGSTSQAVFQEVVECLHGAGYEVILVECDAVAFQRNIALPEPLRGSLPSARV